MFKHAVLGKQQLSELRIYDSMLVVVVSEKQISVEVLYQHTNHNTIGLTSNYIKTNGYLTQQ